MLLHFPGTLVMAVERKPTGPLRIVHAEDNKGDALVLAVEFERAGIDVQVELVGTMAELAAAWQAGTHDLLLLDLSLPDSPSPQATLDTARAIVGNDVAIIILTGMDLEETGIAVGPGSFIHKERHDRLVETLKRLAAKRGAGYTTADTLLWTRQDEQDGMLRRLTFEVHGIAAQVGTLFMVLKKFGAIKEGRGDGEVEVEPSWVERAVTRMMMASWPYVTKVCDGITSHAGLIVGALLVGVILGVVPKTLFEEVVRRLAGLGGASSGGALTDTP